ncbi:MerR family transcriptional regulator [Paractinoplanes rishiriensis]|uniref:MerR family transcriptional regulator n=1 Tax=Paractinoplanes rishiriensis TaxID=1050105 RepID=UPI0019436E84|nr:MerR family transcriptional regulator [Actinoplanes rishiriensis]
MGELSRRSGVPIPTIKYYLREGLLAPGVATAANQADYTEEHVRRLKLIRALIDVGRVSVAGAREVIDALSADGRDPLDLLGEAQYAIAPRHRPGRESPEWPAARERVVALVEARGWLVHPDSDVIDLVADALSAGDRLGVAEFFHNLEGYADAAVQVAAMEVRSVLARPDPAAQMELVVLGTVLGEALFSALRMLAHQHESARQLGFSPPTPADHGVNPAP